LMKPPSIEHLKGVLKKPTAPLPQNTENGFAQEPRLEQHPNNRSLNLMQTGFGLQNNSRTGNRQAIQFKAQVPQRQPIDGNLSPEMRQPSRNRSNNMNRSAEAASGPQQKSGPHKSSERETPSKKRPAEAASQMSKRPRSTTGGQSSRRNSQNSFRWVNNELHSIKSASSFLHSILIPKRVSDSPSLSICQSFCCCVSWRDTEGSDTQYYLLLLL
jgi:hypothetical protein